MIVENKGYLKKVDFENLIRNTKDKGIAIVRTQKGTDVAILDIPKLYIDSFNYRIENNFIVHLCQQNTKRSEWKIVEGKKITKGVIIYYSETHKFEGLDINYNNGNQIMSYKFIEI